MEAHQILSKKGFNVRSFGSGNCVKLPGPSFDRPNVYDFNVTYDEMYKDLAEKDKTLYAREMIVDKFTESFRFFSPDTLRMVFLIC